MTGKEIENWADSIMKEVERTESREPEYYGDRSYGTDNRGESALHYAEHIVNTIAWHF